MTFLLLLALCFASLAAAASAFSAQDLRTAVTGATAQFIRYRANRAFIHYLLQHVLAARNVLSSEDDAPLQKFSRFMEQEYSDDLGVSPSPAQTALLAGLQSAIELPTATLSEDIGTALVEPLSAVLNTEAFSVSRHVLEACYVLSGRRLDNFRIFDMANYDLAPNLANIFNTVNVLDAITNQFATENEINASNPLVKFAISLTVALGQNAIQQPPAATRLTVLLLKASDKARAILQKCVEPETKGAIEEIGALYAYIKAAAIHESCPICFDSALDFTTTCKHRFHAECLRKWQANSKKCPLCNKSLSEADIPDIKMHTCFWTGVTELDKNTHENLLLKISMLRKPLSSYTLHVLSQIVKLAINLERTGDDGWTPLHYACWKRKLPVVIELISAGANINALDSDGWTPLHVACWKGSLPVVIDLMSKGANISAVDSYGWTPLHVACWDGHLPVVIELISAGALVDAANNNGATPLYSACQQGHLLVVSRLIKYGANVNAARKGSWRPLHIACWNGHLPVMEKLIADGADVHLLNSDGESPLQVARRSNKTEVVALLTKRLAELQALEAGKK